MGYKNNFDDAYKVVELWYFIFCFYVLFHDLLFLSFYISMRSKIAIELWQIHNYANIQAMGNMVIKTFRHELMKTKKMETKQKKTKKITHTKFTKLVAFI